VVATPVGDDVTGWSRLTETGMRVLPGLDAPAPVVKLAATIAYFEPEQDSPAPLGIRRTVNVMKKHATLA